MSYGTRNERIDLGFGQHSLIFIVRVELFGDIAARDSRETVERFRGRFHEFGRDLGVYQARSQVLRSKSWRNLRSAPEVVAFTPI
jgi:hypothetical protein